MPRSADSSAATGDAVEDASAVKPGRRLVDRVAVRHPAGLLLGRPASRRPGSVTVSSERPNSPTSAPSDAAAERAGQQLHPVADAQHRDAELEQASDRASARPSAYTDAGPPERIRPLGRAWRPPRRRRGGAAARRRRRTRARGARSAASTGRRSRARRPVDRGRDAHADSSPPVVRGGGDRAVTHRGA